MKYLPAALSRGVSLSILLLAVLYTPANASPQEDLKTFQNFFTEKFKDVPKAEFANGAYIFSEDARSQWEEIEADFPPYEDAVDNGKTLWETPFQNGKRYADCLGEDPDKIRAQYPRYDEERDTVVTLESALNDCRKANNEKPLRTKRGDLADLSGYLAYLARGQIIDIKIPNEKAEKWYKKGKQFYYTKRGQLNMSCADCHISYAGNRIRADILGPALGQTTHFPTHRARWSALGTLHRRYAGCNEQVRAKPFKAQSDEYRALEYFHTYMANGLPWNGPAFRK